MNLTDSQYLQLIVAALVGIGFFATLYKASERTSLGLILIIIPFQMIDSRYGTLNTIIIYITAGAYLLQGRLSRLPFLFPWLFVLFSMLMSFAVADPAARSQHLFYLVGFFSNFLLFYLVYNFVRRTGDWRFIMKCLVIMNVLVAGYCLIQFASGQQSFRFFGIDEFSMHSIRRDGRLVGPFLATAATAEYLIVQSLIFGFWLIHTNNRTLKRLIVIFLSVNALFLVATGNRGGFIGIILGGLFFLFAYRRTLGFARATKILILSGLLFSGVAAFVVNYTDYGMLFDRLEQTEIEAGVPDTRARVWPATWERIQEKPILGHGPKLFISRPDNIVGDVAYLNYPHSLPLFILYTTGIVGLVAWACFFFGVFHQLYTTRNLGNDDEQLAALPRLGLIILIVVLLSQIRIEFLREALLDYQNYLFALYAMFLAACAKLREDQAARSVARGFGRQPTPSETAETTIPVVH